MTRTRSRWLAVLAVLAAALTALTLAPISFAASTAIPQPYAFSHADVGFAEGSATDGLTGRLDAMDSYVGDLKPIIRLDLNWWYVQDCRTCELRWDRLDPIVDAAYDKGMRVLLILGYAPPWAGGHAGDDKWFPPVSENAAWQSIVDATVAHFGPKIQAYEVWNEPNLVYFGRFGSGDGTGVSARRQRYWELVALASARVHAACPKCTVLAGGSANGNTPADPDDRRNDNESALWLDWAYANGYRATFDAVAQHVYPSEPPARPDCTRRWWSQLGPPDEKCGELAAVRAVMVRNGDSAKKIWGTEFGKTSFGASADVVRDTLEEGIRLWRARTYTGPLFLFSFRDDPGCNGSTDTGQCHFGLVDKNGTPKQPAYADVAAALSGRLAAELPAGRSLHQVSGLRSASGRYQLWMQDDGNLVLYRDATAIWESNTRGAFRLVNQNDGNLVLYDAAGTKPLWSSVTYGKGKCRLLLQNDGNLVLYNTAGTAVWSTHTYE